MAYITTEDVKVIRENLKKAFPGWKFSIRKQHHTSIAVHIMEAPIEFVPGKPNASINNYYPDIYPHANVLKQILAIINEKNFDKSDIQSDYFHVGFYVNMEQGKWDKPFVLKSEK